MDWLLHRQTHMGCICIWGGGEGYLRNRIFLGRIKKDQKKKEKTKYKHKTDKRITISRSIAQ